MRFDAFSMCNALYDLQAEIDDALLEGLGLPKGSMTLLSEEQQAAIVPRVYTHLVNTEPGGSGANTAFGLALLGGSACFTSRVGDDEHGELYRAGLEQRGVRANLAVGAGPTGISLILVTPDAQRTMGTFLGRSRELQPEDLNLEDLLASRFLYVTAYLWDSESQRAAVVRAMEAANGSGVRVALSLADPFCVDRHRDELWALVRRHVDVLIGNRREAMALTGADSPEGALEILARHSDVAVVTLDRDGSLLQRGTERVVIPRYPVEPVDTTGAGDMYAAGILFGLAREFSLEITGRIAGYAAAQVVAQLGPRLDTLDPEIVGRLRDGASYEEL